MVHGVLLARVPRDEVDDLVQDIFLHALKKLHTLRDAAAFGPWIAMIARNRAMDFYRSSRETVEVTEQMATGENAKPNCARDSGFDKPTAGSVSRDSGVEICRRHDRTGNRFAHGTNSGISASEPAPRNETASRKEWEWRKPDRRARVSTGSGSDRVQL